MARISFAEFDIASGKVLRSGICQEQHLPRPRRGNGVAAQPRGCHAASIVCDGLDSNGRAVNPRAGKKAATDDRNPERPARFPRRRVDSG